MAALAAGTTPRLSNANSVLTGQRHARPSFNPIAPLEPLRAIEPESPSMDSIGIVFQSLPSAMLFTSSNGQILRANAAAAALFRYVRGELQGVLVEKSCTSFQVVAVNRCSMSQSFRLPRVHFC
jgi:PAS domain-containing protein